MIKHTSYQAIKPTCTVYTIQINARFVNLKNLIKVYSMFFKCRKITTRTYIIYYVPITVKQLNPRNTLFNIATIENVT